MVLNSPCIITSRLLPGIRIGDGTISIEYAGHSPDGRQKYRWYIDIRAGKFTGDDLASGVGGGSLQSGLESLLSFLGACGESYPDGENAELFPPAVAAWAAQNSDELSLASMELEETDGVIVE